MCARPIREPKPLVPSPSRRPSTPRSARRQRLCLSRRLRSGDDAAQPRRAAARLRDPRRDGRGRARISLSAWRRKLQIRLGRGRSRQSRPHLQTAVSEPPKDAFDACPEAARPALACYLAGEISPEVAIMQLLLALGGVEAVAKCLSGL